MHEESLPSSGPPAFKMEILYCNLTPGLTAKVSVTFVILWAQFLLSSNIKINMMKILIFCKPRDKPKPSIAMPASKHVCQGLLKENPTNLILIYLIHNLKVECKSGVWIQSTNLPLTCATSSYFLQAEVKMNVSTCSALPGKTLNRRENILPIWFKIDELLTFSDTQGPLAFRETHGPIAPEIFISLEVWNNSLIRL